MLVKKFYLSDKLSYKEIYDKIYQVASEGADIMCNIKNFFWFTEDSAFKLLNDKPWSGILPRYCGTLNDNLNLYFDTLMSMNDDTLYVLDKGTLNNFLVEPSVFMESLNITIDENDIFDTINKKVKDAIGLEFSAVEMDKIKFPEIKDAKKCYENLFTNLILSFRLKSLLRTAEEIC